MTNPDARDKQAYRDDNITTRVNDAKIPHSMLLGCATAATSAALAPHFGNDPHQMSLSGLIVGVIVGAVFDLLAMLRSNRTRGEHD